MAVPTGAPGSAHGAQVRRRAGHRGRCGAGGPSYTAIAEWAHDLPVGVRVRLGLARLAPSESTIRRTSQAVDADHLDQTVSAWLVTRPAAPAAALVATAGRVIAIDGKSARRARGSDGRAVHLLAAFDHHSGIVLGQTVVDGKTNEITAFAPLLDRVEITGAIITADALHTQRAHADYLHERGAHYVLTVKGNQPGLRHQLTSLPWAQIPAAITGHSVSLSGTRNALDVDVVWGPDDVIAAWR